MDIVKKRMQALPFALSTSKEYCNFCPGYCCYRLKGAYLFLTSDDINRIARNLDLTDGQVRKYYLENKNTFKVRGDGACIFLSNDKLCKRCTIHQFRPLQCQEFPYDQTCPYLERVDLLNEIQPRIEKYMKVKCFSDGEE